MYWCQLNFALFCATSALGIFWQHLNHPNLLVRSAYRFHIYFHVQLILHNLGTPFPYEHGYILIVLIMLFVMIMMLTQVKHGCMGIGFTRQAMQYSPPGQKLQKRLPQII